MANLIPNPSGVANSTKYYVKIGDACVEADNFPGDAFESWPIVDLESENLVLDLNGIEYVFITHQFQVYNSASLGGLAYRPVGLYTDTAGTIPATAPGDKIARWDDVITDSGLYLSQGTESLRPELQFEKNKSGIWTPVVRFFGSGTPDRLTSSTNVNLWENKRGGLYVSHESETTPPSGSPIGVAGGESLQWNQWRFVDPEDNFGANDEIDNGVVRWSLVRSSDADHNYYEEGALVSTKSNDTTGNYSGLLQVSPSLNWSGDMHGIAYSSDGAYRADLDAYLEARSPFNLDAAQILVVDGNELTLGIGATNPSGAYPHQLSNLLGDSWTVKNFGVVDQTTVDMSADASTEIDPAFGVATKKVLIAWECSNHLFGGASLDVVYDEISQYCQARRDAGEEVIVLTVLPRSDAGVPGSFDADRQELNDRIKFNWPSFADGIVDVASISGIGVSGDESDPTYYSGDDFTLNSTGYGLVATEVNAAIPYIDDSFDDLDVVQLVDDDAAAPPTRTIYGVERYTDPVNSGTPRQLMPKYGITFNGSTEYATAEAPPTVSETLTMSAWYKCSNFAAGPVIMSMWDFGTNNRSAVIAGIAGGNLNVGVSGDGTSSNMYIIATSSGGYDDGEWHHVALVFDSGVLKFYIDGQDQGGLTTQNGTVSTIHQPTGLRLGATLGIPGSYLPGSLDDIRAYDTALTDAQVADLASITPGSQVGANVGSPLVHYKCEDPVSSPILRNSGSLGSLADATITTAALATVRGTASPVFSFANSVGGSQAWCSDGSDDYLSTQLDMSGATAFTVWRRSRQLSTSGTHLDGFVGTGGTRIRLGCVNGEYFANTGQNGDDTTTTAAVPAGKVGTLSISSTSGGTYSARIDGIEVETGAASAFSIGALEYLIGGYTITGGTPGASFSHTEYYEYLIADRVLTDDELTWLETGGQAGTAIDFEDDPNILLYTDFSDQTATQIRNHANPNLPLLKAVGGELTMVPRSESDTTKDIDQADYSYRTAVYLDSSVNFGKYVDLGAPLIPAVADFDISVDFLLMAETSIDGQSAILSQYDVGGSGRFLFEYIDTSNTVRLFINGGTSIAIQAANNAVTRGKWHTMRAVRVGDVFTVYLDGVLVGAQTQAGISVYQGDNTRLGSNDTVNDDFKGLVSNLNFSGIQYLTTPDETISGATLTNASYVNVVRGKPGTIQHTGIAPRDMPLSVPCFTGDGVGDYVSTTDLLVPTSYPLSASCRFYWDGNANKNVILSVANEAESTRHFTLRIAGDSANELQFQRRDATINSGTEDSVDIGPTVTTGEWHEVAVRINSDTAFDVWYDGTKYEFTGQASYPLATLDADAFIVGQLRLTGSSAWFFEGRIADAKLATGSQTDANMAAGTLEGNIVHYPLTEGAGDVAHDVSGNGNDGTINGTLANIWANQTSVPGTGTLVEDGYSVGTWFDGTNDYFSGGAIPSQSAASFSVSAWVFAEVNNGYIVADWMPAGNLRRWAFGVGGTSKIVLLLSADGTVWNATSEYADYTVPLNTWVHLAATHSGTETKFYANGTYLGVISNATTIFESAGLISVGAFNDGQLKWDGALQSCVAHYGAVWSDTDVASIMAAGKTSEIAAIVSDLGGTAYYFPDGKTETLQGIPTLTVNGAPEQRVIPSLLPVVSSSSPATVYNGTTDYFSRATLVGGANRLCVAGKIRLDELSTSYILVSEDNNIANQQSWFIAVDTNGNLFLKVSADGTGAASTNVTTSTNPISVGTLHSFSATWEGGTVVLEVDGLVQATTGVSQPTLFASSAEFQIGARDQASNFPWKGEVSQLLVHKDPTVVWDADTKAAIRDAHRTDDIAAITSGLGGTAWYFPAGNGIETLQGISQLTQAGEPSGTTIPARVSKEVPYALGTKYFSTEYYHRSTPIYSSPLTQISAAAYIKLDNLKGTIVGEWTQTGAVKDWSWTLYTDADGKLRVAMSQNSTAVTEELAASWDLSTGVWYHVAFTVDLDANSGWLYIDGQQVDFTTTNDPSLNVGGGFTIGARDFSDAVTSNPFIGVMSHLIVEDARWQPSEIAALSQASTAAEVGAIRPNAYYFPNGNNKETLQGVTGLVEYGSPKPSYVTSETVPTQFASGELAPLLPKKTYGPGVLPPGCSLDLYANQDDAPMSIYLAQNLADGTYNFGDGDEANMLITRQAENYEELAVLKDPAAPQVGEIVVQKRLAE